jgi:hypothetical protein
MNEKSLTFNKFKPKSIFSKKYENKLYTDSLNTIETFQKLNKM